MADKIITKKEEEELGEWAPRVVEEFRRKGIKTIIALDKKGRPAGLLVWKAWSKMYPGEKPELFFLDPTMLKAFDDAAKFGEEYKKKLVRIQASILEKEHPHLFKKLAGEKQVGVIDEYVFTGKTKERVEEFIKGITGKKPSFAAFRKPEQGMPSWGGKHRVIGVSGVDEFSEKKFVVEKTKPMIRQEREEVNQLRRQITSIANRIAEQNKAKQAKKRKR